MQLDPKEQAQKIVDTLWSTKKFPVDPITIAKRLGLKVVETDLPKGNSGALVKQAGEDATIILDKKDHDNRKRFTSAHELGHYISRIESQDTTREYAYIDLRSELSSRGTNEEEVFANKFAANLLMPQEAVASLHRKKMPHFAMAVHFGVSPEALKYRLKKLNLL